jgi:hypothetical protein
MFPAPTDDPWTDIAERQQVRVPDLSRQLPLDFAQVVALSGCVLLIAGVFLPFHRGNSLWEIGLLDGMPLAGMLILVLAQVSLALAGLRWHVGLWLTSFAVFMTVICSSFGRTPAPVVLPKWNSLVDGGAGWALLLFGAFLLAWAAALAAWKDYRRAYPFINANEQRSPLARS